MTPAQLKSVLWSVVFVCVTAAAVSFSGRNDSVILGALLGLILAYAWQRFFLEAWQREKELGKERLTLNLQTFGVRPEKLSQRRTIAAALFLVVWAVAVVPPILPQVTRAYTWLEQTLRTEQVQLRIEFPSYTDAEPKELALKGNARETLEVDLDSYVSVQFRYRKAKTQWQVNLIPQAPATTRISSPVPKSANFGHSAKVILQELSLSPQAEHLVTLEILKNGKEYARQNLKITPQPRPTVELSKENAEARQAGLIPLSVKARSKIPLASIEFHVRTLSGYRMVKPVAEFANANEQNFNGENINFNTQGIPFTPKDTLFIKAVAKTVAEGIFGESEELKFDIVTRESIRQNLIQSLEKSLQALQSQTLSAQQLKNELNAELAKAQEAAQQMGAQSLAARQMEKINSSAEKISAPKDKSARETEQKIKNLLERLKREQTANQVQNLLARLQNLKFSIQRSNQEQLPQLSKDASELRSAAEALKKQLSSMVEKQTSGLTLPEKQAALDALRLDRTPENLKELEQKMKGQQLNESINKSQSTLEHAQKQLGGVLAMLQAARQRAMREARDKLTRADKELQNARQDNKSSRDSLDKSQQDLDSLPQISEEFEEAARDAQKGNQQARQGAQNENNEQMNSGIENAQDGIVRALAALQDEEDAERQSQQEQDGQNFRSTQEAIAAQGQLDMGWRRQILEEIARLRASGEPSDSPAIRYLESRLR
ncbi:MAG: hypothetical protein RI932_1401 [Pseudomonadota bacterium]